MTRRRHTWLALASVFSLAVVGGSPTVAGCGGGDAGAPADGDTEQPAGGDGAGPVPPPSVDPAAIRIWFKLDPRLTTGHYMGERWASPPTFHVAPQAGSSCTVEARAQSRGGSPSSASTTWVPSDAEMVRVVPAGGGQVVITVLSAGRSHVTVSDGEASTVVTVDAVHTDGSWQVQLSQ
jgi:hypothetical protein